MPQSFRIAVALLLFFISPLSISARGLNQSDASSQEASLTLKDTAGQQQSLADYRGRIVILNFWATWCVPCREEMPMLVALQKRFAARGIQVIAPSADEESTQKEIPRFARKAKINFPIWVGATTADMQRLGLGVALPATAIIDRDGSVAGRLLGPLEKDDLEKRIEWLLGDRQAPAPEPVVNNIEKPEQDHDERHKHDDAKEEGHGHGHEGEEEHEHGGVGVEGASTVPS